MTKQKFFEALDIIQMDCPHCQRSRSTVEKMEAAGKIQFDATEKKTVDTFFDPIPFFCAFPQTTVATEAKSGTADRLPPRGSTLLAVRIRVATPSVTRFLYDVFDACSGHRLGTRLFPAMNRLRGVAKKPGTRGLAYLTEDGQCVLWDADERVETETFGTTEKMRR
jgi:hypothetical protein